MIDIVNEIERHPARGRHRGASPRARVGRRAAPHLRRGGRGRLGRAHQPERLSRWFLPVSGDFRVGGSYQLEGNAGGGILACDRPNRFRVTWAYGEPMDPADVSELEIRLTAEGGERTTLELEHIAFVPDDRWAEYGPGAVGVGWDQGLLGLGAHLRGESLGDPMRWAMTDEGADVLRGEQWGMGCRERSRRRRSRGGRQRRGEHHRVLRALPTRAPTCPAEDHTPPGASHRSVGPRRRGIRPAGRRAQAVASWATFAGWRIRMALPNGSRMPMSVP